MRHLLARPHHLVLLVRHAVPLQLLQEVLVVDHDAAGVGHAPGGEVPSPVDPPEDGAVAQVEVGHRAQGQGAVLLDVQLSGAEAHQRRLQVRGEAGVGRPLVGAEGGGQAVEELLVSASASKAGAEPLHFGRGEEVAQRGLLPSLGGLEGAQEPRSG